MAKKKRKRRSIVPESEAKNAVKKSFREFNWKLAGKVFALFVVVFSVYQALLKIGENTGNLAICYWTVIAYVGITTILLGLFIILNRGISNDVPTRDQLKNTMSDEEKDAFIEEIKAVRKRAKKVLVFVIPFILTLLIDAVYLIIL